MRLDPNLYAKLLAQPDDLELRLECARWMEQHGAARRAEMIRGQVALRTRLDPVKRREVEDRLYVIRKNYDKEWMAEVPGLTVADLRYRLGFIEELELDEHRLARDG